MDATEIIGLIAASLTTAAFLPQVAHTWRTRSARDISAVWIVLFSVGIALWLVYGISVGSLPVILGNAVTLVLVCVIAGVKFGPLLSERTPS